MGDRTGVQGRDDPGIDGDVQLRFCLSGRSAYRQRKLRHRLRDVLRRGAGTVLSHRANVLYGESIGTPGLG